MIRKRLIYALVVSVLLLPVWTGPAAAHPHAWIDLRSTLVFDDKGHAVALKMDWLFGDFYSAYILEDILTSGEDVVEGLRQTARGNLVELESYRYFTDIRADGERIAINRVETFETGVDKGRVFLKFTVPFKEPLDPREQTLRYAVYDPTYYVEVLYAEGARAETKGGSCTTAIVTSEPTFEQRAFAASLDQTESGGDGLGELFAEWVELACP